MDNLGITRRSFVKATAIAGVSAAVFGLAGCAPTTAGTLAATGGFKPGTYTAASQGKFGPVNIEATFSESALESIVIGEHEETKFISDRRHRRAPVTRH